MKESLNILFLSVLKHEQLMCTSSYFGCFTCCTTISAMVVIFDLSVKHKQEERATTVWEQRQHSFTGEQDHDHNVVGDFSRSLQGEQSFFPILTAVVFELSLLSFFVSVFEMFVTFPWLLISISPQSFFFFQKGWCPQFSSAPVHHFSGGRRAVTGNTDTARTQGSFYYCRYKRWFPRRNSSSQCLGRTMKIFAGNPRTS